MTNFVNAGNSVSAFGNSVSVAPSVEVERHDRWVIQKALFVLHPWHERKRIRLTPIYGIQLRQSINWNWDLCYVGISGRNTYEEKPFPLEQWWCKKTSFWKTRETFFVQLTRVIRCPCWCHTSQATKFQGECAIRANYRNQFFFCEKCAHSRKTHMTFDRILTEIDWLNIRIGIAFNSNMSTGAEIFVFVSLCFGKERVE